MGTAHEIHCADCGRDIGGLGHVYIGRVYKCTDCARPTPAPSPRSGWLTIADGDRYLIDRRLGPDTEAWKAEAIAQRTAREQAERERDRLRDINGRLGATRERFAREREGHIRELVERCETAEAERDGWRSKALAQQDYSGEVFALRSRLAAMRALVLEAIVEVARRCDSAGCDSLECEHAKSLRARLAALEGDPMGDLVRETERLGLYPHQQGDRMPGAYERMPEVDDGR